MTLSSATTPGQSGPGSNGNERVLRIPQSPSITGTSPSDCLMSYPGYLLGVGSYSFAEVQSVYSTAPHLSRLGKPEKEFFTSFAPNEVVHRKEKRVKSEINTFMFYGISTTVGYLQPNPVFTHILNIYDL